MTLKTLKGVKYGRKYEYILLASSIIIGTKDPGASVTARQTLIKCVKGCSRGTIASLCNEAWNIFVVK